MDKKIKYIRVPLEEVHNIPRHNFVGYIHGLNFGIPTSSEEYINFWKKQEEIYCYVKWNEIKRIEALKALEWLVENGLARIV